MENIDNITSHLYISQALNFIIHLIILIACIIIVTKKKSIATIALLIGGILNVFTFVFRIVLNATAAYSGKIAILDMQVVISYLNNLIFLIFGLGLLLFAINDLKKNNNV